MKKVLLSFALLMSILVQAREQLQLNVNNENEQPIGYGYPKSPIKAPVVFIEDYTLSFSVDHPDYVLMVKDENGDVVFTTSVFSTETLVTLPSALSGDYQIEIVMGYWKFTGWISL